MWVDENWSRQLKRGLSVFALIDGPTKRLLYKTLICPPLADETVLFEGRIVPRAWVWEAIMARAQTPAENKDFNSVEEEEEDEEDI